MSRYGHEYGEVPLFRTINYSYLRPPAAHDTSTTQSPSSGQSPMSPSSSVGPDHVHGSVPFLDVPSDMPEDPSHSLIGISPQLPDESNSNDIEFDFADVLGTSPLSQLPGFHSQTDASSENLLERLRGELERVEITVQEIASHPGGIRLYDVKSILKNRFIGFETTIQGRIDYDEQPNFNCKLKDRYLCKLCQLFQVADPKVYSSRGVFRRHVSAMHHPRSKFICPAFSCPFTSSRRDKLYPHLRQSHQYSRTLRRDQINRLERRVPPPATCEICWKSVDDWEDYFKCVSEHCRLREGDSTYTSASQSRRSSGDSGSGANGGSGNFNGGGFPGGPQNFFTSGGWNAHMNGGSFNSYTDPTYFSQASSYSNSNDLHSASFSRQSLPGILGPGSERSLSFKRQTLHHSASKQLSRAKSFPRETDTIPRHRPSLLRSVTESSWSSTDAESGVQSPPRKSPSPGLQSDDSCIQPNLLADLLKKHLQKPLTPGSDVLDKRCKNCDHIMSDCTNCLSLQLNVDRCHLCMDKPCQVVSRNPQELLNCGFPETDGNQAADCTDPDDSTLQLSDRRLQDDLQSFQFTKGLESPEKESSLIKDDRVHPPNKSFNETMNETTTMDGLIGEQTDLLETSESSDSPPSMILVPKLLSSSIDEAPASGIQQQLKPGSMSRALPYPNPPSNLHNGLGIYACQRPKLTLDPISTIGKMVPHLVPPSGCMKRRTEMSLSTEMSTKFRHGRPKSSRPDGTHSHLSRESPQPYRTSELQKEVKSHEDHQDIAANNLNLITLSSPALNKRSKHLDPPRLSNRPIPSKHILSRKKCHALRTKLQVIVEILALRKSSKAPILDPKESNVSYLKSIIPRGPCLKSPVFDFDIGRLDIPSSLPLLLETLFLLQTDPKGNTSNKLTNYIYDHDDEMHLMLFILIPLLTNLLWKPTIPVDTAIAAAVEGLEI